MFLALFIGVCFKYLTERNSFKIHTGGMIYEERLICEAETLANFRVDGC